MDGIGVLTTCPMFNYLEVELKKHFKFFKLWRYPSMAEFLGENVDSVQAVVGNTKIGADTVLIGSLPRLRIVASYSMGLDKIDMRKCEEREIRVTNSPDTLTDDVANKTYDWAYFGGD
ncbi:Glyoxylate reductase [Morus notabilis]|uniref:Glyoxylate reductase n=1 Tax=Morus notabilis TaxID=981085 RepID=W9RRU7_9ROSA|nr:hydroxyphenylpyruvate reductase [Morus notabilis]XP_010102627.1 hydroxyphenylpyruvate reductase [Morus notabilis]EXB93774.1 Glyoxylate reductase [Morus notabilis]EXB93777.1 Glyoxylate reductase [Morus notabilis]